MLPSGHAASSPVATLPNETTLATEEIEARFTDRLAGNSCDNEYKGCV